MSTNRLFTLLTTLALVVVVAITIRETVAANTTVQDVDSATRSYMNWAKAMEAEDSNAVIDSAAQSYIGQAKSVECGANPVYELAGNSATRSYIGWAKSTQCGNTP